MIPVRVGAVEVLVEVSPVAGSQPTSAGRAAERAAAHLAGAFERAQEAVEEIAVSTARTVGRVARRVGDPDQVEVEFGVKVSAKGDVILAGASAEASLKVKIVYAGGRLAPLSQQNPVSQENEEVEPEGSEMSAS
jgi:hypothetical protein